MRQAQVVWMGSALAAWRCRARRPSVAGRCPCRQYPQWWRTSLPTSLPPSSARDRGVAVPALLSFDDLRPGCGPRGPGTPDRRHGVPPRPPTVTVVRQGSPAGHPPGGARGGVPQGRARGAAGCHLRVSHLAAIGQVESGSIGGRSVVGHRVTPAIYGPLLDGGPFAVIRDSDGGGYDGAGDYDRAMGPLQFLPGTWRWAGRDGDGDGRRDPQNVFDAALGDGRLPVPRRPRPLPGG